MQEADGPDYRLSYSSASELRGCEQRYYHRKVAGTKQDSDYEEGDAFSIGKAFHYILEHNRHEKPEKMGVWLRKCTREKDILLNPKYYALLSAMVLTYVKLHKKSRLKVVGVEDEIVEEDYFRGFIDVTLMDMKGNWWLSDMKTFKYFDGSNIAALRRNVQLTLYSAYAYQIAEKYGLDMEQFQGFMYRVVTKPGLKQTKHETQADYAKRLFRSCKAFQVEVPFELLDIDSIVEEHTRAQEIATMLIDDMKGPRKNYANCFSYFKPCPYWSKCHGGKTFTESQNMLKVLEVYN